MLLNKFLSKAVQPQPQDKFQQTLYLNLQGSIVLLTEKPEFENIVAERLCIVKKLTFVLSKLFSVDFRG